MRVFSRHEYSEVLPGPSLHVALSIIIKKAFLGNTLLLFYTRILEVFIFLYLDWLENAMVNISWY